MLINIKRTQSVFQLDYLTSIVLPPLLFKNILTLKTSVCFPQSFILALYILHARRRRWHPTPVLLPGKSHGRRSLVGCSPCGREESDMTETSFSLFTFIHWRRKWQPTPVLLPGESQGWQSLVGCRLWGRTESDMTEVT